MAVITREDCEKVEMRVGMVTAAEDFPEARNPSHLLTLDFGPRLGVLRSSAAIAEDYAREALIGRLVVSVVNFPAKQFANHMSQALGLAAVNDDGSMKLLQPDGNVQLGARVC